MDVTLSSSTSDTNIDWLFGELHGRFGNRFLDAFRSGYTVGGVDTGIENMKRTWAERIRANGLTSGQVRRGLAACERLRFPPTWGEFLEACQPRPDAGAAYHEAVAGLLARGRGEMGDWSHPAVYWAAMELRGDLLGQTYGAVRERWDGVLKRHLAREQWAPIPEPRPALPSPGTTTTTREEAAERLRALGASGLLRKLVQPGSGSREWAARILERVARGEAVPLASVLAARAALGPVATDLQA
jgi:hypothetical protein